MNPGAYDGTDIGFELGAGQQNFFIPGSMNVGAVPGITVALSGDGTAGARARSLGDDDRRHRLRRRGDPSPPR